jgi:hypothetical protein
LNIPVIFLVFNRPHPTQRVFRAIAAARPRQLLVVADGPRDSRPGEGKLCGEVRSVIDQVNWPCEVLTNFASSNLGCGERVITGLDWAFSLVQEAIILEDDCLPHETFFPFCQELLERYRGDSRIGMVSGNNFVARHGSNRYSYRFSRTSHIWGWATWREAWQRYDRRLQHWEAVKTDLVLREVCSSEDEARYWTQIFESMYDGSGADTWDYQWTYTLLLNNMLSIVPSVNLIRNIGFGQEATHTIDPTSKLAKYAAKPLTFPMKHPPYLIPLRSFDELDYQAFFKEASGEVIRRKLRSLRRRLRRLLMETARRMPSRSASSSDPAG